MSEDRGERIRRPRGRKPRRKVCAFCVDKIQHIDYKDVARLRRFTSERGKILPRRMTGTALNRLSAHPCKRQVLSSQILLKTYAWSYRQRAR